MPQRSFTSNEYDYGYQGSEKDNEITNVEGAHVTTYFRELDTRIGRWWAVDPIFLPWQSPYSSMDNNPIWYNDPMGNTAGKYIDEDGVVLGTDENIGKKEDNEVYVVTNKKDKRTIKKNDKEGKTTATSNLGSIVKLPSYKIRKETSKVSQMGKKMLFGQNLVQ